MPNSNLYDPTPANVRFGHHGNTSDRSKLAANSAFMGLFFVLLALSLPPFNLFHSLWGFVIQYSAVVLND